MSLVSIGSRGPGASTPAAMLLECHGRIRSFVELALTLARADAPSAEIADAAARLHRYFAIALPLHVEDEEQSIEPRLLATRPELATTLATMHRQHGETDEILSTLLPIWRQLVDAPDDRALRASTAQAAQALAQNLREHLALEERELFPAIDALAPTDAQAIMSELRARRE